MAKSYCFKPLKGRSRWLLSGIAVSVFCWAGAVAADIWKLQVLRNIKNLEYTTEESLEMAVDLSDLLTGFLGLMQGVCAITVAITFACWLYRACANLWAWQIPGVSQKPMWGVLNYFLPIWNLFKPHSFLKELWYAPRWKEFKEPTGWKNLSSPKILDCFWISFLVSRALERYADLKSSYVEFPLVDDFIVEYEAYLISDAAGLVTVILMYFVVYCINRRHKKYARSIQNDDSVSL